MSKFKLAFSATVEQRPSALLLCPSCHSPPAGIFSTTWLLCLLSSSCCCLCLCVSPTRVATGPKCPLLPNSSKDLCLFTPGRVSGLIYSNKSVTSFHCHLCQSWKQYILNAMEILTIVLLVCWVGYSVKENPPLWCVLYVILMGGFTVFLGSSGGICEKSKLYSDGKKKSLNTGIITVQNYASHVPPKVSHITFAHEVGHNFGSPVSILSWALSGCGVFFYRSAQL